jgi:uncharacterized protein
MPSPQELVLSIVQSLVDRPDRVTAAWTETPEGPRVEITAEAGDRGKVIGRRGRTIQSLRHLVTAVFGEGDGRIGVELKE